MCMKVLSWVDEVDVLSKFAESQPHVACGLTSASIPIQNNSAIQNLQEDLSCSTIPFPYSKSGALNIHLDHSPAHR